MHYSLIYIETASCSLYDMMVDMDDIECFLTDYQLQKLHTIERVYILKRTFLGIFKTRLYLYLNEDTIYNYAIQKT